VAQHKGPLVKRRTAHELQAALTVDGRGCQDVVNRAGQAWQLGMMLMQAGVR
jgi:hypothetical protein